MKCVTCDKNITIGEGLKCKIKTCERQYHIACLNITVAKYMGQKNDYDNFWKCPDCENVTKRRNRSDNTPVRSAHSLANTSTSPDDSHLNYQNILGDTINSNLEIISNPDANSLNRNVTLEQISILLDRKFKENRISLLAELEEKIELKISNALKVFELDVTKRTKLISTEQKNISSSIDKINKKLETLESENKKLTNEINTLQEKIKYQENTEGQNDRNAWTYVDNSKTIILYGLSERFNEDEYSLNERIINIFYDLYNVDLTGYIEETTRLGSRGYRRPLKIELISKRMVRYLLRNSIYFKHTGLFVSEYLDRNALQERKVLKEELQNARKAGKYAVIKNNVLYIDGEEYKPTKNKTENVEISGQKVRKTNNSTENDKIEEPGTSTERKQKNTSFRK